MTCQLPSPSQEKRKAANRKNVWRRDKWALHVSKAHEHNAGLRGKKETGKKIRNPIRGVASQGWGWGNQPHFFWESASFVPLANTSQEFGLPPFWDRANPWTLSASPALEHKSFSSIYSCQCTEPPSSVFSYLSTAVASVVDCRERETEASGTVQSQEVAETPQKSWGDGEERSGKAVEGGAQLLANSCCFLGLPCGKQRQLQAIPRSICQAISKITHQFKVNYIYLYLIIFQLGSC